MRSLMTCPGDPPKHERGAPGGSDQHRGAQGRNSSNIPVIASITCFHLEVFTLLNALYPVGPGFLLVIWMNGMFPYATIMLFLLRASVVVPSFRDYSYRIISAVDST